VVYAHPVDGSFCAAVRDRATAILRACGHEVDLLDLHAEGFEPCPTAEEAARQCEDRLAPAGAVVFVYPTWWSGPPAIMNGWLDSVWAGGERATHLRRLVVLTTHGSSKHVNFLEGEVGKHLVGRTLRSHCGWRCQFDWVAMYRLDTSTADARRAYLDRVARRLARAFG